ncbi:MAG: CopG family transcriptional regulator [Deltaproteobacteria bacterium]|nr:CopG family transcriptional regulator [Deltaproteobacteria bacterium]
MVRTVISLGEEEKEWLDRRAAEEGVPMTEIIRQAVKQYRSRSRARRPSRETLLKKTRGTWKHGDGLEYQRKIRDEW